MTRAAPAPEPGGSDPAPDWDGVAVTEGIDPDIDLRRRSDARELREGQRSLLVAVAAGGAVGALGRYAIQAAWTTTAGGVPWPVLAINLAGCAAIGVLLVLVTERLPRPHRLVRPFLGTGVLGGFTTMSTYADEVWLLLRAGRTAAALGYAGMTLVGALLAVGVAVVLTRAVAGVRPVLGYRP